MGAKAFVFRITPSIVHICFLTMLTGHLLSLTTGFLSVVVIGPGASTALPQQAGVEVLSTHTEYYHAPSPLQGLPRQSEALVRLRAPGETTLRSLSILCPISWRGFSLHLSMDKKAPGSAGLKLFIQRDPGVGVILSGFTALIVLTGWYLLARRRYGG